jgi:hypothetical protein
MATTRRPQINHKSCDHAATPKARKACRKAWRQADRTVNDFTAETSEQLTAMRAKLEMHPSSAARLLVIEINAELERRANASQAVADADYAALVEASNAMGYQEEAPTPNRVGR